MGLLVLFVGWLAFLLVFFGCFILQPFWNGQAPMCEVELTHQSSLYQNKS